jgi:hypothetical protein
MAPPADVELRRPRGAPGRELTVQRSAEITRLRLHSAHVETPLEIGGCNRTIGADDVGARASPVSAGKQLGPGVIRVATRMTKPYRGCDARRLDHDHPSGPLATEEERRAVGDAWMARGAGAVLRFHRLWNTGDRGSLLGRKSHL